MDFRFSTSLGGNAIVNPVDFGNLSNTGGTASFRLYIENLSTSHLHNCGFYLQPFAGTSYVGLYGESADYLNLLTWGTDTAKGLRVNLDPTATGASFNRTFYADSTSGTGSTKNNAIVFATDSFTSGSSTEAGHFPSTDTGGFTFFASVPATETAVGLRQFTIFMRYEI